MAGQRLSWEGLRDTAAGLLPGTAAVTVLSEENSLHFAAAFAAAVAGERQCAVLDPTWPQQLQDSIRDRIRGTVLPAAGTASTDLADGPPGHAVPDRSDVRHHLCPQGLQPLAPVLAAVLRRVG